MPEDYQGSNAPVNYLIEDAGIELKQDQLEQDGDTLHVRDHDLELALLTLIYVKWFGTILRAVHGLTAQAVGVSMPLDQSAIQRSVLNAKARATIVEQATRTQVARRIGEGLRLGLSREEIIRGTDDFPGLNGLYGQTWRNRPMTIARTELQEATLESTIDRAQALARGRLSGWLISDGDYDAQCAERDGRIAPVNNPPGLLHPNCRLTLSPVIR